MKSLWAEALQESFASKIETVPDGWKTSDQIAAEIGKSGCRTRSQLCELFRAGRCEKRSFRIACGTGDSIRPVPHYRLKK